MSTGLIPTSTEYNFCAFSLCALDAVKCSVLSFECPFSLHLNADIIIWGITVMVFGASLVLDDDCHSDFFLLILNIPAS